MELQNKDIHIDLTCPICGQEIKGNDEVLMGMAGDLKEFNIEGTDFVFFHPKCYGEKNDIATKQSE